MRRLYYIKPNIQYFFTIVFTFLVAAELGLFFVLLALIEGIDPNVPKDLVIYFRFGSMLMLILCFSAINFWFGMRLSHRIVGPLVQIQRALDSTIRGASNTRIKLRSTDFLHDVADKINIVLDDLREARKPANVPENGNGENAEVAEVPIIKDDMRFS